MCNATLVKLSGDSSSTILQSDRAGLTYYFLDAHCEGLLALRPDKALLRKSLLLNKIVDHVQHEVVTQVLIL